MAKWPFRRGTGKRSEKGIYSQINVLRKKEIALNRRSSDGSVQALPPNGSGLSRLLRMISYVTLKLGQTKSGSAKTLHSLRSTADYYGWTEQFEEWVAKPVEDSGKYVLSRDPGRRGHPQCSSGYRVRLCRAHEMQGFPAGFTNAFKVSANTGLFDLAELAHFTKGDWYWMSTRTGERVTRAHWEDRYADRL